MAVLPQEKKKKRTTEFIIKVAYKQDNSNYLIIEFRIMLYLFILSSYQDSSNYLTTRSRITLLYYFSGVGSLYDTVKYIKH